MQVTTVGLDLAKNIFQAHGITGDGTVAFNRALRRGQVLPFFEKLEPCLIGMEACGTSHYWARELSKLGHEVRLMPPIYVKPYVKRGKTDAADAAAICEAVTRPTMRFVAIKSPDQQGLLSQHRARQLMIGQRTQLANMIRGLIGEFGCIVAKGLNHIRIFAEAMKTSDAPLLPAAAGDVIASLCEQLLALHQRIGMLEKKIFAASRKDARVRLLETIPGIGPRHRAGYGLGDHCYGRNTRSVQDWTRVRRLAGPDPTQPLERGQGKPRQDIENGRPVSASVARRRHDIQSARGANTS